ncbi:MAG TPA: ester cyclase [Actinomycetota bacterium]|jgi:predicted ester cyclase|nr:ester cyclase [Actinomycetota bacterium]
MSDRSAEEARNEAAFRRLIEQGFSRGDTGVVDEVFAEDFVEHQSGIQPPGREGVKAAIAFLHRAFPDLRVLVQDLTVAGDKVWAHLVARGTHEGHGFGEPTGRRIEIDIMDLCRFQDGQIVEHWGVPDRFAQMQQLGLLGSPEQRGEPARPLTP